MQPSQSSLCFDGLEDEWHLVPCLRIRPQQRTLNEARFLHDIVVRHGQLELKRPNECEQQSFRSGDRDLS